ncbi:MAG: NAD(P)H-binding protein [Anaerolineae bacterium]|nr:NAD(P)H-binding protein [Anaerolineae bacterium]
MEHQLLAPPGEPPRVLVTGATSFLGYRVVAALQEAGAQVSALVHPDQLPKTAAFNERVRIIQGDLWNRASLKGSARGHQVMIHLVGSTKTDPERGLTYQQINLVSARHAVGMAISDGVRLFTLLSAAALPGWMPLEYIHSKRDAETYLANSGLEWIMVRAPLLYLPGPNRPLLNVQRFLGTLPPWGWLSGRYAPMSVNTAARGLADPLGMRPIFSSARQTNSDFASPMSARVVSVMMFRPFGARCSSPALRIRTPLQPTLTARCTSSAVSLTKKAADWASATSWRWSALPVISTSSGATCATSSAKT